MHQLHHCRGVEYQTQPAQMCRGMPEVLASLCIMQQVKTSTLAPTYTLQQETEQETVEDDIITTHFFLQLCDNM